MSYSESSPRTLAEGELKKSLQGLGFTDHESRAYMALSDSFPATAYEVAQRSGLPRANAYSVLGSLTSKGAVQEVMRDPIKYAPVDANEYFGHRASQTAELCSKVAESLKARTHADEKLFVWAYRGHTQVHSKLDELIVDAKVNIWIKGPYQLLHSYLQELTAAANRGVKVILIVFGDDVTGLRTHPDFTVFLHEGRGTNRGASNVVMTVTTDSSTFMIAAFTDEIEASYGKNPSVVYVVETMILHEIYLAEMYDAIGPLLDERFDEHFGKLRKKYRPLQMGLNMLRNTSDHETAPEIAAVDRQTIDNIQHALPKPAAKKRRVATVRKS